MSGGFSEAVKKLIGERATDWVHRRHVGFNALRESVQPRARLRRVREAAGVRWGWMRLDRSAAVARPARAKPHGLFVTEKWCDYRNPAAGPTNSEHNLFGSLEASGLATYDRFHFDEFHSINRTSGDLALLKLCRDIRPDFLVLTWVPAPAGSPRLNPALETLRIIRRSLGVPICAIWFDSVRPAVLEQAESISPAVDVHVALDCASAGGEKFLPLWCPQDPRLFHDPGLQRDIDVSFVGSANGFEDRQAGLAALRAGAIALVHTGGQREERLPVEEYARIHMRSRIALNFCRTPGGYVQCKGRVFEILHCGAMLLEADNPETRRWLTPLEDYVPFTDSADLVRKAHYYLEHDIERRRIAAVGHRKAVTQYSGAQFWRTVLDRLHVQLNPQTSEDRK